MRGALSRRAALAGLVGVSCQRKGPPPGPAAGATEAGPTAPPSAPVEGALSAPTASSTPALAGEPSMLDWSFPGAAAAGGAERALVIVPRQGPGDERRRFPVLVALHGRGEAVRGPEAGAYGWVRDYHLPAHLAALGRGVLRADDFQSFVAPGRLSAFNEALRAHPYAGLIVVCPHTPDVLRPPSSLDAAAPFGRWVVEALLPKVFAECPAATDSVGIDGVSLGGRVALLVGAGAPATFKSVGTLQPAFQASEAAALTARARAYLAARPEGRLRLLTSEEDPFREAVGAIHEAWRAAGLGHEHRVVLGPHNYAFNRGPGGFEMLLWHERVLRGLEPILGRRQAPRSRGGGQRARREGAGRRAVGLARGRGAGAAHRAGVRGGEAEGPSTVAKRVLPQAGCRGAALRQPRPTTLSSTAYPPLAPLGQSSESYRKAGALGARLASLHRRGLPLPATWVLDADPCRDYLESNLPAGHEPTTLLRLSKVRERLTRAGRAREALAQAEADPPLRAALEGLFQALAPEAPRGLVLRYSATTEDETVASMAQLSGQARALDSPAALERAVFEAWSLLYLPSSLAYLAERGARDVAMALVVQPLVEARVSGTLFTRPPDAADAGAGASAGWVVQAHWGLGACSYDAGRPVDTLRMTRRGQILSALAAPKPKRLAPGDCELREEDVPPGDVRRLCVDQAECERLADVGARVEAAFGAGGGWAIDFALGAAGVVVTGARPMHGRGYPAGGDERTVWSRAFSGETPGGVLSPLTQSLLLPFSERGLRQGLASLGGSVARGATLVRFVHGRLYANMTALVEAVGSVPGLDAGGLADWSGVAGRQALGRLRRPKAGWSFARVPITAARLLAEQTRLGIEVERFEHAFGEAERGLDELDLAILPDDALAPTLREARALLTRTGALHLGASTGVYASHLALRSVLSRRFPVTGERHAHAVTAGLPGLPSVQPLVALARLSEVARSDAAAAARLGAGGALHPADLPDGPFRRAFARFLDEHGDRATGEAELCEPRWRERPEPLLAVLAASLAAPLRDPAQAVGLARRRAEAEFARLGERLSLIENEVCKVLLDRTRKFLFLRERLRAALSKAFALVRRVALEVDRRLRRFAPGLDEGAAFYCTDDELLEALATGHPEVGHAVRLRRYERRRLGRSDPPLSFAGTPSTYRPSPPSTGVLRGLPASGGVVTGPVCVLASPSLEGARVEPGAIVVAPAFDLGLTPLLLVAGGLVLEGGGLLSSSLLVARELGVPAVVDVEGATLALRPGERVRLDGDTGTVEPAPEP